MAFCKHRVMDSCKKDNRPCIFSEECFEPEEKKMTNADRIRSMGDEELVEFMDDITPESQCHVCAFKKGWLCEKPFDKTCRDGIMQWLKSEVGCE